MVWMRLMLVCIIVAAFIIIAIIFFCLYLSGRSNFIMSSRIEKRKSMMAGILSFLKKKSRKFDP
jgi:hypothetical protein